jgi:hypothetical protein
MLFTNFKKQINKIKNIIMNFYRNVGFINDSGDIFYKL